jgi:uncharacterized coiled-coil protein SlyX
LAACFIQTGRPLWPNLATAMRQLLTLVNQFGHIQVGMIAAATSEFRVTWQPDNSDIQYEPEEPEAKRRVPFVIVAVAMAVLGSGSAFGWRAYAGSSNPSFAFSTGSAGTEPKTVGSDEFQAFQQQIAAQMQANAQDAAAQRAELKRLSDQLAVVSGKLDAIQSSFASARASLPAATPPAPRKPAKPKPPAERISTGGAPLPPPTQLTH